MPAKKLWIVAATCGDYYCGCANNSLNERLGSHLIGVYTSEALAQEAVARAGEARHVFQAHAEPRKTFTSWYDPGLAEIEADVMPLELEVLT